MKILMIATYYLPRVGGGEESIRNYSKFFKSRGHHVEIITKKYDPGLKDFEEINGIKVNRIPYSTKNKLGLLKFWVWMLKNRKKFEKFDVVMYNDFSGFYWYLPLKFLHRKPSVILYYGYEGFPIKRKNKILRRIAKIFTTKTVNGGRYLDKYYGFKTDYYIHAGAEEMERVSWQKKKKAAIFVGGLREDTSILEYLKSLKILKERYNISLGLDIYGGGDLEKFAKDYVKFNGLDVNFRGVVAGAKRFIPNYKYGFATQWGSVMDCMRSKTLIFSLCKLPITLDYDREILMNGKYGSISTSPEEMAEQFHRYQSNKKLVAKTLDEAYEHAEKEKTWPKLADKMLEILKEAVDS